MAGVTKIEIIESIVELEHLLEAQKTALGFQKVQVLYLLKTQQVKTVQNLASMLGRGRVTLQRWLRLYREGGISRLLEKKKSSGRPPHINSAAREQLLIELAEARGFKSYTEIQIWLKAQEGIEASYKVVHDTVRYRMKAKLKVPRPVGIKYCKEAEEEFKKNYHYSSELSKNT